MIVVSDISPICYLILIDEIEILHQLYGQVMILNIVQQELSHWRSPEPVKTWIKNPPEWLIVKTVDIVFNPDLSALDAGEQAAIILAEQIEASLVIIDDALGRKIAQARGLKVTGLLGILDESVKQNLLNLPIAINRLQMTTFRASKQIIQSLLRQDPSQS